MRLKKLFQRNRKQPHDSTMGCSQSKPAVVEAPPSQQRTGKTSVGSKKDAGSVDSSSPRSSPGYAEHVIPPKKSKSAANPPKETIMGALTDDTISASSGSAPAAASSQRPRFASYASGASTPDNHSDEDSSHHSESNSARFERKMSNPKTLVHSTSAIGLDEMIEDRREMGDIKSNVVHIEVPFGKPIEEVYEGVHNGPVLGSGISGLVRLVTHKATGLKYAVKVLDLGLVDTSEGLHQLREEIFIMCQLDHPNIVRLEEVYESQSEIYLVQELCLGGELFDRLDEQPDYHYTEAECARLVKQMLSAVRYLHSKGIIHRDLKLENFLFSSTSTDSELKMIDFGLSKHFRYGEVQHEAVGTPYTVAPEVIRGSYDERCDIWAIGVISFLLLSGDPPFGGCGGPEPLMTVRSNILRGEFAFEPADIWANVSSTARQFIRDMLKTDPKNRPTARQAQKHEWLQVWASRDRKVTDNVLNPNVVKALVNFKEYSDMRKLLCEVLSFTLLPYQIKELRREFEKMDTDGSGEISLTALKQVLLSGAGAGSLGALTEEEVEDIFNAMRVRKTETRIHWHEFIAAGLSQCQVDDRNLRLAFDRLDSDHKGYIILDDIMDLMGSDALQSEEDMRRMWGDSIKAVKCQHARITYDDFLLLMKGQTKEPSHELERELGASVSSLAGKPKLHVVPEVGFPESPSTSGALKVITLPSGDQVAADGTITQAVDVTPATMNSSDHTPPQSVPPLSPLHGSPHSAPTTPADHKKILGVGEMESPPSMDEADDILSAGPGVPGSAASLTPPTSPLRGAMDYATPSAARRGTVELKSFTTNGMLLPELPGSAVPKPEPYSRRRSKSVDEADSESKDARNLNAVADAVRDMILPETDHHLDELVSDQSKSALQVNRQLYRAHRQMRLAVLEASKRFEEQQAEHAREVILAQREGKDSDEGNGMGMIQAGLVMRHGLTKQVSSKAIRLLLEQNRLQQQALVEKANRRGGRGRRSRKKTISDMSGLLASYGQEDMGALALKASQPPEIASSKTLGEAPDMPPRHAPTVAQTESAVPNLPDLAVDESGELHMRGATVPGEFRKTADPFGREGRYGASSWK